MAYCESMLSGYQVKNERSGDNGKRWNEKGFLEHQFIPGSFAELRPPSGDISIVHFRAKIFKKYVIK